MKIKGLSILIQGPLNKDSACLDFIKNYQKYGDVVISCYDNNQSAIKILEDQFNDLDILCNNFDVEKLFSKGLNYGLCPDSTFIWALYTQLQGLYHIDSDYTLKVRTDEGYEYLDDFINMFLENDNKIICGNIFHKTKTGQRLHMGDHIFIGKTKILRQAVQKLFFMYLNHESFEQDETLYQNKYCAETVLARSILRQINPNIDKITDSDQEQEFFLNNILPYDTNGFKRFIARWNHLDITFKNKFDANVYLSR